MKTKFISRIRFAAISAFAGALLFSGCATETSQDEPELEHQGSPEDVPTATSDSLEAKAKEEGKVVWYTNEPRENATEIADLFTEEYPEIDVEIMRLPGEKIAAKLEAEFSGAGLEGDIAYVTPAYTVQRLAEEGAFAPFYPENIDDVDDNYKDPEGKWVSTGYVPSVAIAYNTELVSQDDAPTSWKDLTDEKWKNKIALGDPASLTVATQAAASWIQNFGEDYVENLGKNNPVILSSFGDTEAAILSGSSPVGTVTDFRTYADMAEDRPIELVLPEEGAVATPGAMGINVDAKHPNAARLFANFLYSDAAMEQYASNFTYPVRPGFAGEGMPDLKDVTLLDTDDSVLIEPNEMVSLRRQLNSLLG